MFKSSGKNCPLSQACGTYEPPACSIYVHFLPTLGASVTYDGLNSTAVHNSKRQVINNKIQKEMQLDI